MIQTSDIDQANALLQEYYNQPAFISIPRMLYKRLLMLINPTDEEPVWILLDNCLHITGTFSWRFSMLQISLSTYTGISEPVVVISDEKTGFKLIAGNFLLCKGNGIDYKDSVAKFLSVQ